MRTDRPIPDNAGVGRPGDPDADVLELARCGDRTGALRSLMNRHGVAVYRYCREMLRDAALADDVHQQVFLQVFNHLSTFSGRSTLRTWLFAIARNRVLDAAKSIRRKRSHVEDLELVDVPDPCPMPSESLDDQRLRRALIESLHELEPSVRTVLLLRYQQGLTYEEIAEICGEKAGTLQAKVARALPRLRRRIEARIGELDRACDRAVAGTWQSSPGSPRTQPGTSLGSGDHDTGEVAVVPTAI